MDTHNVEQVARKAGDHPVIEGGARLGYAVNGVMHLVIAWLAVQLALGQRGGTADQGGAMSTLADQTPGLIALWLGVIGYASLSVWQLPEAIRVKEAGDRVKCLSKMVLYAALAFSAFQFATGHESSSRGQTTTFTQRLMSAPAGEILVGLVGVGIIGIGIYHVIKGARQKFMKDLQEHPGTVAVWAGRVGYVAKGVALALVGGLFVSAALHNNPKESTGLDGALRQLLTLPFGSALLLAIGVGFAAFAGYCVARARYAKV